MAVSEIKNKAQFDSLIRSGKTILIDFTATWCGPCKMISPIFEKLALEHACEGIEFYKVDVDDVPDVAQEVGIRAMPTFQVFKNGTKLDETVGANPQKLMTFVMQSKLL